jgi:hypothetical protein
VPVGGQGNRSLNVPKVWKLSVHLATCPLHSRQIGHPKKILQSINCFVQSSNGRLK